MTLACSFCTKPMDKSLLVYISLSCEMSEELYPTQEARKGDANNAASSLLFVLTAIVASKMVMATWTSSTLLLLSAAAFVWKLICV